MTAPLYAVIRPDGTRIESRPEINMEFSLWSAAEVDAEVARRIRRNRLNNVQQLKRAGYSFEQV